MRFVSVMHLACPPEFLANLRSTCCLRLPPAQSTTRVKPFICTMPMRLDDGWNQIQFNLSDFTRRAYGTNYIETLRVQVHANCRVRRIYFSDRLYSEEELPPEFKLFLPIQVERWGLKALEGLGRGRQGGLRRAFKAVHSRRASACIQGCEKRHFHRNLTRCFPLFAARRRTSQLDRLLRGSLGAREI